VVFSESRRFCSAALCDVLRRTGDDRDEDARALDAYTFPADMREISVPRKEEYGHDIPGNIGFRLGLTSATPLPFLVIGTASFPRPTDFPLPSFFGGERPLFMPSAPKFIMLAGVTGVKL
jgi:hypothetical protein